MIVGFCVGAVDGLEVGFTFGCIDGCAEGCEVGCKDGIILGNGKGRKVGLDLGETEGEEDGCDDGNSNGGIVGDPCGKLGIHVLGLADRSRVGAELECGLEAFPELMILGVIDGR